MGNKSVTYRTHSKVLIPTPDPALSISLFVVVSPIQQFNHLCPEDPINNQSQRLTADQKKGPTPAKLLGLLVNEEEGCREGPYRAKMFN